MKTKFIKDIRDSQHVEGSFMIMKKLAMEGNNLVAYIGDKTGDIKAYIPIEEQELKVGDVIHIKAVKDSALQVTKYKKEKIYDLNDYLPAISKPLEDIMA